VGGVRGGKGWDFSSSAPNPLHNRGGLPRVGGRGGGGVCLGVLFLYVSCLYFGGFFFALARKEKYRGGVGGGGRGFTVYGVGVGRGERRNWDKGNMALTHKD